MEAKLTDDEKLVAEQLETFGVMKFPPNFMDIGEKRSHWVFENRPEWVKFTKQWEKVECEIPPHQRELEKERPHP